MFGREITRVRNSEIFFFSPAENFRYQISDLLGKHLSRRLVEGRPFLKRGVSYYLGKPVIILPVLAI